MENDPCFTLVVSECLLPVLLEGYERSFSLCESGAGVPLRHDVKAVAISHCLLRIGQALFSLSSSQALCLLSTFLEYINNNILSYQLMV